MQRLQQPLHHLSSTRAQAFQHPLQVQVHELPSRPLHGHPVGAQGNHAYPYAQNDDSFSQKERRDRGTMRADQTGESVVTLASTLKFERKKKIPHSRTKDQ